MKTDPEDRDREWRRRSRPSALAAIALALTLAVPAAPTAAQTTLKDIGREAQDVLDAFKSYGADKREELVPKAKAALDELDRRIEELDARLERKGEQLSESARRESREQVKQLRAKRNEIAEWYGGLKHSSAAAWEHVKKGFSDAFGALSDALAKAEREF
jgi:hypothetical protein